jgi:hypothetical protein
VLRAAARDRAANVSPVGALSDEAPRRVGVFPLPRDPLHWSAIFDYSDRYLLATVNAAEMNLDDSYPRQNIFKPAPSDPIRTAESAFTTRIFLDFARYPLVLVNDAGQDVQVFFTDLRFGRADEPPSMGVDVVVNARMQVVSQRFAWRRTRTARVVVP